MPARPSVRSYPNVAGMPVASPDGSVAFSIADGAFAWKVAGTWTLLPAIAAPATATPLVDSGAGAVGVSPKYARQDHVHPAAAAGGGLEFVSKDITLATLQALGAGVLTYGTNFSALPAGARLIGATAKLAGAAYVAAGLSDVNLGISSESGVAGITYFVNIPIVNTAAAETVVGAATNCLDVWGGTTPYLTFDLAGLDLNTLSAGSTLTVKLFYSVAT